jgi:glutamate---cysteine ligase / carboxylate-amine ligase
VEVRVGDACLTADDAVTFAGVVRTLVAALIDDNQRGVRNVRVPTEAVNANLMTAARHGMRRHAVQRPVDRQTVPGAVARLLAKISPFLDVTGDADEVYGGLDRLLRSGTGADRQRLLWSRADTPNEFVAYVADVTVPVTTAS